MKIYICEWGSNIMAKDRTEKTTVSLYPIDLEIIKGSRERAKASETRFELSEFTRKCLRKPELVAEYLADVKQGVKY